MIPKYILPLAYIFNFLLITSGAVAQIGWNDNHAVGVVTGKYHYTFGQIPDQLVEIHPARLPAYPETYQWFISSTPNEADFVPISGATGKNYTPTAALTQTTYFRRRTTSLLNNLYSNILKISVVSANWEDKNYVREHAVMVSGVTTWQQVDALPIGDKLQTTTYVDGLGRKLQTVSRETATPASANGLWGDVVQFSEYDAYGREQVRRLPYTTTAESGKYKTDPQTAQAQYYTTTYNETNAYAALTFDNSPLNRVKNAKQAGSIWAASAGNSAEYDMNEAQENVQKFSVDYVQGNAPVNNGPYGAYTLFKTVYIDENGKKVVEYTDKAGRVILKKIQLDDAPGVAHAGWICTYSVYDELGMLRYQLQPEAVKYLDEHSWSFAGTDGLNVLKGLCYQYNYDDKGRTIWKKAPGAEPLTMIYDKRDRLVFTQDGNQAALTPTKQWTATLYDVLDRHVMTTLYATNGTVATLQGLLSSAAAESIINIRTGSVNGFVTGGNLNISVSINPFFNRTWTDWHTNGLFTVMKINFYDNYSFPYGAATYTDHSSSLPYAAGTNIEAAVRSNRTLGMPTGSYSRIIGAINTYKVANSNYLIGLYHYNERGQILQTIEAGIRSSDVTSYQYHFDGRMLGSYSTHSKSGMSNSFAVTTKRNFDKLGRTTSIDKNYFGNGYKTIASIDYDDMGRVKTKRLDPNYNANGMSGLESLNYSYNIQNQITGINKDYALKTPGVYNKWEHFFGLYLGFDNKDNKFAKARLNGQVTGLIWSTQGDDAQRKYNYDYDNANRLVKASFSEQQHPGDGWSDNKMDFSVSGTNGKIIYDLNGNLLNMLQKGVQPGGLAPITIDDLSYSYAQYSNKLQTVTDQMTNIAINGKFGDFKDGVNSAPDYGYDANGSIVTDLNKNAKELDNVVNGKGIAYNFLDKPERIRIAGKGVIRIVYSAEGKTLQKAFFPENGDPATITTYIGSYVYQQTAVLAASAQPPFGVNTENLNFINFEEGRIRAIQPIAQSGTEDGLLIDGNISLPTGQEGVFDYFIRDYQQNVRMVLTEEINAAYNTCTMEAGSRATIEEPIFGQTGSANEVATTRYPKPGSWSNPDMGASVSRLGNIAGHNIGPNTLQKVMAGDEVSTSAFYYYNAATGGSNSNFINTVLTSLGQAIAGSSAASGLTKASVSTISNGLNGSSGFISAVQPGSTGITPKAYLTMLFFDERFNLIDASDGGTWQQQVNSVGTGDNQSLSFGSIKAPKNGYVFVYVSNESDQDVYFDNFKVGITRGRIIEENHYYSYGLKIAAISSSKPGHTNEGRLKNDYLYNDKQLFDDATLDWYDYGFRNYDAQIGRFPQLDPLTNEYPFLTPYQYGSCDPITNIDIDGLEGASAVGGALGAAGDFFQGSQTILQTTVFVSAVKVVKATQTVFSISSLALSISDIGIRTAATANGILNDKIETNFVGNGVRQLGWQELSKDVLKTLVQQYSGKIFANDGQLEDYVGDVFEWTFHSYAIKNFTGEGYTPNSVADHDDKGLRSVIDAKSDGFTGLFRFRVPQAAWWEIKAKRGGLWLSTSNFQILREIGAMKRTLKTAISQHQASYNLVTTSDTNVGWSVGATATLHGINYSHWVSEYQIVNGIVEVRFKTVAPPYGVNPQHVPVPLKFTK